MCMQYILNLNPCCYNVWTTVIVFLVPTGGSVYMYLTGMSLQNAPSLTTLSCETEHLLAVRLMYIF